MKNPDKVMKEIGKQSEKSFLPIVGPVKGKLLEKLVMKHKPERILEIGVLVGYSSILMAKNMEKGKLIGLEINPQAVKIAKQNIEHAGLENRIGIILGDAKKTIKQLEGKFDFIFIDAVKEEYLIYLKLLEDKMKKGTIIAADNAKIFKNEMGDYLDYVRTSGKYKSKFYDFGFDGVEVSVRI